MAKLVGRKPVEVKITAAQNNYIPVFDGTTRSWTTINKSDIVSGSATLNGNNSFTGSQNISGSLNVVGSVNITGSFNAVQAGITGSLLGTASYASQSLYSDNAQTASYVVTAQTASYWSGSIINAQTASYAESASYAISSSYAATSSFADNFTVAGTLTAQTIIAQTITSSVEYITGSTKFGSLLSNTHQFTGSVSVTGSLAVNNSNVVLTNQTSSMSVATASYVEISQTASYVTQAQSASYWSGSITNAATASYVVQAQSASYWSGSITNAATASYVLQAVSASYATTASYAETASNAPNYLPLAGGTMTGDIYAAGRSFTFQDLLLGAGTTFGKITTDGSKYISVMPTYNVESARFWPNGNVTIQDAGTYVDNGFRLDVSGSGRFTDGLTVTGSLQAINGITGSLLGTASQALTASSADDFTVRGTLTAQKIVAQTITSSTEFITGSTKFGSLLTNTHQFTGSVGITGSLNINGSDYITTSGSASTRLTALELFSGSYNTGSFSGSFIGRVTGSFSGSLYNLQNTVLGHIPFFSSSQVLADSIIRQLDNGSGSYSIVINQDNITTAAPEALYVWQPSNTSYNVIAGKGNLNSYLQLNIQNLNTGENASSDVVATANNGNESINYIDMGINSEGFTGSIGNENDAYLYSTGNHLHIGNASNFPIQFFAGGIDTDANRKLQLFPNNAHELTGSLSITNRLNVLGGVTASLQGTASWANNAINATSASYAVTASLAINANNATNAVNAQTASYVVQAQSASYWSGSIINAATASYVQNAQTASYVLQAISASFATSASYWSGSIINAASASYVLQAVSASYATSASFVAGISDGTASLANTASYAISASYAATASSANDFLVRGTLTAQTIIAQTITSSIDFVTGSTRFGTTTDNTHQFTGSVLISGSLGVNGVDYTATSASFDTRILNNSGSIAQLSGSYLASSASFDSRINVISSSYATTGSNVFVGNQTITGSLLVTGSNTLIGNTSLTGSISISGSTTIKGITNFSDSSTTITGSLLISGSTTQIGTNTLAGNTILSGSIIISGSTTVPSTPTIKIYGDAETNGVIKFLPVVKNIDNSISASYVFVSGSTQDLYFSQNGAGYSNVTRLRWLEGNLYTGLLNGGNITAATGSTTFNVSSGSGIIVNLNASLTDNPYPTIKYVNWGNLTNQSLTYLTSSIQTFVGINDSGTVTQQTGAFNNGQYNTVITIGTVLHQNKSTVNASITYPNVAYGYKQRTYDFLKAFGPLKLSGLIINPSSSLGLTVSSGTAFAEGRNYQIDPNNPSYIIDTGTSVSKIFRYYQSGSQFVQDTNNGAGYTVLDPANYNPGGSGSLAAVPTGIFQNRWSIQRVFWYPNSATKGIVVYYGSQVYASEIDAAANLPYEPFLEVENTKQNAVYLGAIALRYDADFTNSATYRILPGGLFRNIGGSGGGGTTVSTLLSSLSDVNISGPTNGQPLVYSSATSKWANSSTLTASLHGNADTATSSSYALTASFVNGISNGTASYANTASFALTASYLLGQSPTSSYALTASYVENAQTASYVLNAQTASYVQTAQTASYILNAVSASYAATSSFANNFTVGGTLTAQTLVVQTITSSVEYVTGSTQFGSTTSNTHQFTGSVLVTGSVEITGSVRVRGGYNQSGTDSNLFNGSTTFGSPVTVNSTLDAANGFQVSANAARIYNSASIGKSTNPNAVLDVNGSTLISGSVTSTLGFTGSLQGIATTASYVVTAQTASYVLQATSASYWSGSIQNATSASYALTASYAANVPETASYALQANTASFALTASYISGSGGGVGFPFSGSAVITGSFLVSQSFVDFTQATYVTGSFTGSFSGTATSASYSSYALYAGNSPGMTVTMSQAVAATTWSFVHNLNTRNPLLQVYDSTNSQIIPYAIIGSDPSVATLYFDTPESGYAVASNGGALTVSGSTARLNQTSAAVTWSFTHNLATKYPNFEIWDSSDNIVIPAGIHAISDMAAEIYFSYPSTGIAIASFSGIAGAPNAATASYAVTATSASYSNNFVVANQLTIDQTLTDYHVVPSSAAGENNMFNKSTGSYSSAFFKYTVSNGSNARAGEVMAVWNGGSVQYVDNSTSDIGNTSGVTAEAVVALGSIQFNLNTVDSGWKLKSLGTFM